MEKEIKRAIQLICALLLGSRDPAIIPYTPSKTDVPSLSTRYFKRTAPHKKGVSDARLQNFLSELEENKNSAIHSVMVLKDGEIICEAYAPGYERGLVHLSHSMSKTVTGIAVAILGDEEKLHTDTAISEIFTEYSLPSSVGAITVGDLLLMSSGLSFSELGAVTSTEWTVDFLSSDQAFPHASGYKYNSMNSYLLARIIEKLSGECFEDFLHSRIFSPLKITDYFWERGPEGTEKGGWGLYMSLEDWLKIASLFISGGKFENTQIISHLAMLDFLFTRNEFSSVKNQSYDYGGHIKLAKDSGALLMSGLFGQNIYIDPKNKLAVAVNSGSNELFDSHTTLDIIMKYFPADMNDSLAEPLSSHRTRRALSRKEKHFFESRSFVRERKNKGVLERLHLRSPEFPSEWNSLLGKYLLPMNNQELLPLTVRVMQNNLEGGIDTVEFLRVGSTPHIRFTLGNTVRDIPIGIYSHEETVEDFRGEKYRIRTLGAIESSDDGKVYKIEFVFPELPNTRTLTVKKSDCVLTMSFSEMPNVDSVLPFIDSFTESSNISALAISMIERKLGDGYVKKKLHELFSPTLKAPLERAKNCEEILSEENASIEKARMEILSVPFISSFVKTEIKNIEDPPASPIKKKSLFGLISGIIKRSGRINDSCDEEENGEEPLGER